MVKTKLKAKINVTTMIPADMLEAFDLEVSRLETDTSRASAIRAAIVAWTAEKARRREERARKAKAS